MSGDVDTECRRVNWVHDPGDGWLSRKKCPVTGTEKYFFDIPFHRTARCLSISSISKGMY